MSTLAQITPHPILPINILSSLLLLASIVVSIWYWSKNKRLSPDQLTVAFGGIVGAFLGAKIFYVLAELPIWIEDPQFWLRMLAGKTIMGGLLGGWAGIVLAKRAVGVTQYTGDEFARIIPLGIGIGRLSCMIHGCCPGRSVAEVLPAAWAGQLQSLGIRTWPAPWVEIGFQLSFWFICISTKNVSWLKGQQFNLYLVSYGLFRTAHEHFRGTVRYEGTDFSPYMFLGFAMAIAGAIAAVIRHMEKKNRQENNRIKETQPIDWETNRDAVR